MGAACHVQSIRGTWASMFFIAARQQQHGNLNIFCCFLEQNTRQENIGCVFLLCFWCMFFLVGINRKRNFLKCRSQVTKTLSFFFSCGKTIYLWLKLLKHLYCVHNSTFLICHHNLQTTFCSLNVHIHKTIFSLLRNTAIQTAYFKPVSLDRSIFFLTEL